MEMRRGTKIALISSVVSVFLCFAMLLGTTFAWFTDAAESKYNKVVTASLDVDLEFFNTQSNNWESIKESKSPIFNYLKWEPGYTEFKVLKVENEGDLALTWDAKFVTTEEISILADVIDVYVCVSNTELTIPTNRDMTGYTKVGTLREFLNSTNATAEGTLLETEAAYLGIALQMRTSAGNEFKRLSVTFDIQIHATQVNYEEDSVGDDYDAGLTPGA